MKRIIASLIFSLTLMCAGAFDKQLIDSLEEELSRATTLEDSMRISLDLFDGAHHADIMQYGNFALSLARRLNDKKIQLELLRRMTYSNFDNDSIFNLCYKEVMRLPVSTERSLTMLFIKLKQDVAIARSNDTEACHQRMHELMTLAEESEGRDLHTRIRVMFALCVLIEQVSTGEILTYNVERLGELLEAMPNQLDAINLLYLNQAAATYTAMGNIDKAVEIDKAYIAYINKIHAADALRNRQYRDFTFQKYIIYRRLLGNYMSLTPDEVEEYYNKLREIADHDLTAKEDFDNVQRPLIYYYMSHGHYAEALPLLQREVKKSSNLPYVRRQLLNCLFTVGQALNNREAMNEALMGLHEVKNSEKLKQSTELLEGLQLIYDDNMEKLSDARLEVEKRDAKLEGYRISLILGVVSVVVLAILLFMLRRTLQRTNVLNKTLKQTNITLTEERDNLRRTQSELLRAGKQARAADKQKEQFIKNMNNEVTTPLNAIVEYSQLIADCADEDRKPYLAKFVNIVKVNAELLQTFVNDVLDLSTIDKQNIKIEKKPVMIDQLVSIVADTFRNTLPSSLAFECNIEENDSQLVTTDTKRVAQVLLNLLSNAAKFTERGTITLAGRFVNDDKNYEFSVTDTGIGIPEGKEEIIFNSFEKLNSHTPGVGLGLSVSRMIANLLGGSLKVDTTYREGGARFLFIIPIK